MDNLFIQEDQDFLLNYFTFQTVVMNSHSAIIRIPYLSSSQTGYLVSDRLTSMLIAFNLLLLYYTKTCKNQERFIIIKIIHA